MILSIMIICLATRALGFPSKSESLKTEPRSWFKDNPRSIERAPQNYTSGRRSKERNRRGVTTCNSPQCFADWTPVPNMAAALEGYNPMIGHDFVRANPGRKQQIF